MKKNKSADLARIDELAVEILSDEELEAASVTGADSASCSCCVAGATVQTKSPAEVGSDFTGR